MNSDEKLSLLNSKVFDIFEENKEVFSYYGVRHTKFLLKFGEIFGTDLKSNLFFVKSCCLVHDLFILAQKRGFEKFSFEFETFILVSSGYVEEEILRIKDILFKSRLKYRLENSNIDLEAQAFSDANCLYKILPSNIIFDTKNFLSSRNMSLGELAVMILNEQKSLFSQGKFFYSNIAKEKYLSFVESQIFYWENVLKSLEDNDLKEFL